MMGINIQDVLDMIQKMDRIIHDLERQNDVLEKLMDIISYLFAQDTVWQEKGRQIIKRNISANCERLDFLIKTIDDLYNWLDRIIANYAPPEDTPTDNRKEQEPNDHNVCSDRERLRHLLEECEELRITEIPDYSVLDPFWGIWDEETKRHFLGKLVSIDEKNRDDQTALADMLEMLKEYFFYVQGSGGDGDLD